MTQFRRPAQRLLVQGVLASTACLVRELRDGAAPSRVRRLMSERRRMLGELSMFQEEPAYSSCLRALDAAIAESDRTVEALIA